jgi:hypothetical protein
LSVDTVFQPLGPTVLVAATAAVQVAASGTASGFSSIRVRNLSTSVQYFSWGPSGVTSLTPSAGTPAPSTLGMLPTSVETFQIPAAFYFIASSATGFEMTPGQGA